MRKAKGEFLEKEAIILKKCLLSKVRKTLTRGEKKMYLEAPELQIKWKILSVCSVVKGYDLTSDC